MKSINAFLAKNPWLYVVLAFAILLGAWSTLISIAIKHSPAKIEITR